MRMLLLVAFVALLAASSTHGGILSGIGETESLYKPDDNTLILSTENFTKIVNDEHRDGKKLQFIQFFASWCGHCQHFAPIFKKFLKTSLNWRDAIDISVCDCGRSENDDICRRHNVMSYPTLRMFKFAPKSDYIGDELDVSKQTISDIREGIFKWIQDNAKTLQFPQEFPHVVPLVADDRDQLVEKLLQSHKPGKTTLIVVEKDASYLGRELMFDFYSQRNNLTIYRMVESDVRILDKILPSSLENFQLPFLLQFDDKSKFNLVLKPLMDTQDDYKFFATLIKNQFLINPTLYPIRLDFEKHEPIKAVGESHVNKIKYSDRIYQRDLNNALRHILFTDVPKHSQLSVEKANALNQLLLVIHDNFPFQNEKTKTFVKNTQQWLKTKIDEANRSSGTISTADLVSTMKTYDEYFHLPELKSWKSCADIPGSGKTRSYPCSLWTMFHVLTVAEYKNREATKQWIALHQTVYAMRDYIKNFFGCKECSRHFGVMAKNLEDEMPYGNSSIIWLWQAHNRVNARLKGSASEIPELPKRQFPAHEECPACYRQIPDTEQLNNSVEYRKYYNEEKLLEFLIHFYDPSRIIPDTDVEPESKDIETHNRSNNKSSPLARPPQHEAFKQEHQKLKSFTPFSNLDYSMVILLYFVSAGLLATLWGFIRFRSKSKNRRSTSFLPL